jgi:Tfp pilus assembly protein FimT
MVLIIIGIAAAVAVPKMDSAMNDRRLIKAVSEIVTALEFAQSTAMGTGAETRVTFDVAADTILVEKFTPSVNLSLDNGEELTKNLVEGGSFEPVEHPVIKGSNYFISLQDQGWFGGSDITVVNFNASNWLTFNALGIPSTGGTVTLALGSRTAVLTVDALSGRISWTLDKGKGGGAIQQKEL